MGLSRCFIAFMQLVSSFLLFHLTFSTQLTSSIQPVCHESERFALLQFKQSLVINESVSSDPSAYPKVASWKPDKENSNCCLWDGIKCDEHTGHVVKLDLTSSFLYGSINSSSSLFQLIHLQWLSLADNDFESSSIPSEIINLTRLSYLNLSFSGFSGQIPSETLELSKLIFLDVSLNNLELRNPNLTTLVEKLFNLKVLDLSNVTIFSSIPPALTNLTSLTFLSLAQCELQGKILPSVGNLTNLLHLDISFNNFHGELPTSIGDLRSLSYLDVRYSSFSGKIPPSISNLTKLFYLDISGNNFEGELPTFIGNLGSLFFLDVSNSSFTKKLPPSIGNLTNLLHLDISFNSFHDELPTSIGNLRSLSYLAASDSLFSGIFPPSISNLTKRHHLGLSNNSFFGELPTFLGNLTQLTHLYLSHNNLTGEIPFVLMKLTKLTELVLSYNQLTGPIPSSLMNLNKLSKLYLPFNQLTGHIPTEIGNLTQLKSLSLRSNQFEGLIPISIYDLKNLEKIDLSSNNLSGTVDLNMFLINFKSLEALVLSSNKFTLLTKTILTNTNAQIFRVIGFRSCNLSEFPYFLHNQHQLFAVDLSSNKITGQVPRWFLNVSVNDLLYLNLSNNILSGFEHNLQDLPWTAPAVLDLRNNKLQGPLPVPSMVTSSYLISNNQLTGEIPHKICSLKSLYAFDLSYNDLSGMLPECLGNFSNELSVLKLQGNNFSGNIPHTFMNGTNLRLIDLNRNSLQGRIPQSLANCGKLKFLNLGNNQITGIFPSWLGTLPELEVLILKFNRFYGVIKEPKKPFLFPKLRIIDLSHNRFAGKLPSTFFEHWNAMKDINASRLTYLQDSLLTNIFAPFTLYGNSYYSLTMSNKGIEIEYKKLSNLVTAIILSNNNFGGEIPPSIANLKGLRTLNLSNNNLEGHIPSSLTNMKMLESLDLSNNNLSGEIPPQLAELTTLGFFDVSDNNLRGPIPWRKQLSTFDNRSFDGNPELCGEPLSRKCEKSEVSQEEDPRSLESLFAFGWKIVALGYTCGTIIGLVLGHIFSIRKHEWLANTFGLQLKVIQTRIRSRN